MKIKKSLRTLFQFRWEPAKDTAIALILGFLVIATSIGLLLFSFDTITGKIGFYVLRDFIMIFLLGFAIPLYYVLIIKKEDLSEFGITKKRWLISLIVGIILAVLLLFQFISEAGTAGQRVFLDPQIVGPIFYLVTVGGIFEVIFFHAFLRQRFENAFGIIPGILLAALFYTFHHVGLQPEFVKLFFVGIIFAGVFRTTRNILIIYPFFWAVGGCWDVLVKYGAAENVYHDPWTRGIVILMFMVIFMVYIRWKLRKT
jgi:membrane protease YdiL (CAAX protease family)